MRCAAWLGFLVFVGTPMAADDEQRFIALLSDDQLSKWSGDRAVWTVQPQEIRCHSALPSKPLVYDGRTFGNYVLRFSAQAQTGSVRILLRNVWFAWSVEIGTGKVRLHGGGGDGFVAFLNKPGEWADYEVRVKGGSVKLLRNGKHSDFDYLAGHMPETGKIGLQLAETDQGSEVTLRGLRILPLP